MKEKYQPCDHKTTAVLADEGNVTIESCTWGCGELLLSVTDEHGISYTITAAELLMIARQSKAKGRAPVQALANETEEA